MSTESVHGIEAGPTRTAVTEPEAGWRAWRELRLASVNAPEGPAALTRTVWLDERPAVLQGVPGCFSVEDGAVRVQLAAGEDALAEGRSRTGSFLAHPGSEAHDSRLGFPGTTVQVIQRSDRLGLRLFEHGRAGAVERIEAFPFSASWRIEGTFAPLPAGASESYDFAVDGSTQRLGAPGVVSLDLGGSAYETKPFRDGEKLVLVFSDATTGTATKGPCRFVELDPPSVEHGGVVVVDFNRAYLPPCAFSGEFNCPLPPRGHRFATPVTAGETDVAWKQNVVASPG